MKCPEVREQLREAAGVAPRARSHEAEHMAACESCRRYAGELALVFSALPAPERSEAEWARFNNAVYAALPKGRVRIPARRHAWAWRVFPAALAACVLLAVFVMPGRLDRGALPGGVSDLDVLSAVYSDYTLFHNVGDVAAAEPDSASQEWVAKHMLHSGSPIESDLRNDIDNLTVEEMESVDRTLRERQPRGADSPSTERFLIPGGGIT